MDQFAFVYARAELESAVQPACASVESDAVLTGLLFL